jgi:GNAT superfamily N-acetyltransferase
VTLPARVARDESDLDAMIELRVEAERWLQARGIVQWTEDYADYARNVLRESVHRGAAWLIHDDGEIVATVTINGPDPDFWGWATTQDQQDALYLGKMIVSRRHAGRQIGEAIMNWVGHRAVQAGKHWIRLDCRRDNRRLQAYYLGRGFSPTTGRGAHAHDHRDRRRRHSLTTAGVMSANGGH